MDKLKLSLTNKHKLTISIIAFTLVIATISNYQYKESLYNKAQLSINSKDWQNSIKYLQKLGNYKDSTSKLKFAKYNLKMIQGNIFLSQYELEKAVENYRQAQNFTRNKKDAQKMIQEALNKKKDYDKRIPTLGEEYYFVKSKLKRVLGENCGIEVSTDYNFSKPFRVGEIAGGGSGSFRSCFGANIGEMSTTKQFFSGISKILPTDSILLKAYKAKRESNDEPINEIFMFYSKTLANTKDIDKSRLYNIPKERGIKNYKGQFYMSVIYANNPNYIDSCFISLGYGDYLLDYSVPIKNKLFSY